MHAADGALLDSSGEVYVLDMTVSKNLFHLAFTEPAGKSSAVIEEGIGFYHTEAGDGGFGDGEFAHSIRYRLGV